MSGVHRSLVAFTLLAALATAASAQGVPFPPNCVIPAGITLGATNGAALDLGQRFVVLVRDAAGAPVANAPVEVSFGCRGTHVASRPPSVLGDVVACLGNGAAVSKAATDAQGFANFVIGGAVRGVLAGGPPCAKVSAMGVTLGSVRVAVLDLVGVDGVNVTDMSKWLSIFGSGLYVQAADYNLDGVVNITDLSLLQLAMGAGGSVAPCFSYCP